MKKETLHKHLPTFMSYIERRRAAKRNQLPKHLRPVPRWPIVAQMALNAGIFFILCYLMINRDEFMTEAAPALGLVICLLMLIYSLITALQLKQRYRKIPGERLAKLNVWLMGVAALMFPISVAFFLP
jgi:hypothetical protein